MDEPESIDNYEPIRIVDSILNAESNGRRRLFIPFPSAWNGKYGDSPWGAQPLFKYEEFFRRVKTIRMSNDHHIYIPYRAEFNPLGGDYRVHNINIMVDSVLDRLNDIDSLFDMTLICGKYLSANIRQEPTTEEMFYEANLKLMYGAKSLSLFRYFGADNDPNFTGLVNYTTTGGYSYTDRYWFIRNTLSPRLRNLFGKTIKNLQQTAQYAGSDGIDAVSAPIINLNFLKKIQSLDLGESADQCYVDLGFFNDPNDLNKKYFMALNRYYSTHQELRFTFRNLNSYKNWEVTDFIDTTKTTLLSDSNGEGVFEDIISPGDAGLYSVLEVVKYGGKLKFNETISGTNALS